MSAENVDIVRSVFDAYERGDTRAALEPIDPKIEWKTPPGSPTPTWHGRDGVQKSVAEWSGSFESFHAHALEFIDAGERVLVDVAMTGRGHQSGIEIDTHQFQVWTLRDGKAVRMEMFFARDEALRAAGLERAKTNDKEKA